MRVLTPEQLAARLGDRFRLLTGGGRTALRRQQTLQATVDWSHDLLAEPERALFRRLAVFPGGATGGFPLEAAEAVGRRATRWRRRDVLDLLTGLVDKSLVLAEARGAEERYRLLETLRQYAEERLLQAGEAAAVRDRHAAWCLALGRAIAAAEAAGAHPCANPARRRLLDERENVRAALGWWASDPAAAPAGLELLADVGRDGRGRDGERVPALAGDLPGAGARAHGGARPVPARPRPLPALGARVPPRRRAAREAREIFEALGDADGAAEAASHEGLVAANLGDYDRGAALIGAALARARARGDWARVEQLRARPGGGRLRPAGPRRRPARASRRAARWPSATGVAPLVASGLLRLAALDRLEGDLPPRPRAAGGAPPAASSGSARPAGRGLAGSQDLLALELGSLARAEGRHAEARAHLHGALRRLHRRGEGALLRSAVCLAGLAGGRPRRARAGGDPPRRRRRRRGPHRHRARAGRARRGPGLPGAGAPALGEAGYAAAWAAGQAMTLEQAVAYALEDAPDAAASSGLPGGAP